jgi:hypothetical protein
MTTASTSRNAELKIRLERDQKRFLLKIESPQPSQARLKKATIGTQSFRYRQLQNKIGDNIMSYHISDRRLSINVVRMIHHRTDGNDCLTSIATR